MFVRTFLVGVLLVSCQGTQHVAAPLPPQEVAQEVVEESEPGDDSLARMEGYFPSCELVTHEGRRVRFYEDLLRDRVVIVQFMYVHCDGL